MNKRRVEGIGGRGDDMSTLSQIDPPARGKVAIPAIVDGAGW